MNQHQPGRKERILITSPEETPVGEVTEQPAISEERETKREAPPIIPPSSVEQPPTIAPSAEIPVVPEGAQATPAATPLSLEDVSGEGLHGERAESKLIQTLNAGLESGPESGRPQE